jgi:hypothetical protein
MARGNRQERIFHDEADKGLILPNTWRGVSANGLEGACVGADEQSLLFDGGNARSQLGGGNEMAAEYLYAAA